MMRKMKRWMVRHLLRDWPTRRVNDIVRLTLGNPARTYSGPFKGMRYVDRSIGSTYYPKILGTYELELTPVWEELFSGNHDIFIDVGAAEGYFAVGVALRTSWPVIAFEADPRTPLPELAALNEVEDRIRLYPACDLRSLTEAIDDHSHPLLLVDIEGSELLLLEPHYIPALRRATLVVEIHDCFLPGTGQRVIERFKPTHAIERVDTHKRTPSDFPLPLPSLPFDPSQYTLSYMDEQRQADTYWLILRPTQ